jgi:hypothetical protein
MPDLKYFGKVKLPFKFVSLFKGPLALHCLCFSLFSTSFLALTLLV